MREDVLKLTTLHGKTSGDGCCTSTHHPPVAMETDSKGNNGEAVALLCACVVACKVRVYRL